MTEEEKTAYSAKVNTLLSKANLSIGSGDAEVFKTGFNLNLTKNSKGQVLKDLAFTIKQSYSYKEVNGKMIKKLIILLNFQLFFASLSSI
jgi:hypothetical protein